MKRLYSNILFGIGAPLFLATAALAQIALPNCQDPASGLDVVLYTDFQNGQRLMLTRDAKDEMAIVLADCSNGFALQVRDRKNWFDGPAVVGKTIYDRPGQVREFLESSVTSAETRTWDELKRALSRDGYLVKMGEFSPEQCGCKLAG